MGGMALARGISGREAKRMLTEMESKPVAEPALQPYAAGFGSPQPGLQGDT